MICILIGVINVFFFLKKMWEILYLVCSTIILFKWQIKHVPGQINILSDA